MWVFFLHLHVTENGMIHVLDAFRSASSFFWEDLLPVRSIRQCVCVFLPAGEVDVEITQAEKFPLPRSHRSPPHQASAFIRLHLSSPSSTSPPPSPAHYHPPAAHCRVTRHCPRLLPPHTTVLIRLTGLDLGPPPWPPPTPGGCGESGVVDGGGKGECGGGGGMDESGGYWGVYGFGGVWVTRRAEGVWGGGVEKMKWVEGEADGDGLSGECVCTAWL